MNRKKKMLTALMSLMYSVNSVSSRAENLETKPVKVMTSVDDVPNGRKVPDSHGRDPKGKQVAGSHGHVTDEETVQDTVGDSSEEANSEENYSDENYSDEDYSEETATSDESSSDTQSIYNTLIHSPITYIGGVGVIVGVLYLLNRMMNRSSETDKEKNKENNANKKVSDENPFNDVIPVLRWKEKWQNCGANAAVYTLYAPEYAGKYKKYSKLPDTELISTVDQHIKKREKDKNMTPLEKSGITYWNNLSLLDMPQASKDYGFTIGNLQEFKANNFIRLFKGLNTMTDWAKKNPGGIFDFDIEAVSENIEHDKETAIARVIMETMVFGRYDDGENSLTDETDPNRESNLLKFPGEPFQDCQHVGKGLCNARVVWESLGMRVPSPRSIFDYDDPKGGDRLTYSFATHKWWSRALVNKVKGYNDLENKKGIEIRDDGVFFDSIHDYIEALQTRKMDLPVAFTVPCNNNGTTVNCIQLKYKAAKRGKNKLEFSAFLFINCHTKERFLTTDLEDTRIGGYYCLDAADGGGRFASVNDITKNAYYYMYDPDEPRKYVDEWLKKQTH